MSILSSFRSLVNPVKDNCFLYFTLWLGRFIPCYLEVLSSVLWCFATYIKCFRSLDMILCQSILKCILSILSGFSVFLSGLKYIIISNLSLVILHVFLDAFVGLEEQKTRAFEWKKAQNEVESSQECNGDVWAIFLEFAANLPGGRDSARSWRQNSRDVCWHAYCRRTTGELDVLCWKLVFASPSRISTYITRNYDLKTQILVGNLTQRRLLTYLTLTLT